MLERCIIDGYVHKLLKFVYVWTSLFFYLLKRVEDRSTFEMQMKYENLDIEISVFMIMCPRYLKVPTFFNATFPIERSEALALIYSSILYLYF